MRDPATWKPNPKSHRTSRITKIVQSILSPCVGPVSYTSTLIRSVAVWLEGLSALGISAVDRKRRLGTDPDNSFNPSSRRMVVAPFIFPCLSSGGGKFRRPGDLALPPRKPYQSPSAKSSRRRSRPWPACRRALDRVRASCWYRCIYSCCPEVINSFIAGADESSRIFIEFNLAFGRAEVIHPAFPFRL